MWHSNRIWSKPTLVERVKELAWKISQQTHGGCQSFLLVLPEVRPLYFLNDSTSADGTQEYAPLIPDGDNFYQVESIMFGWCTAEEAEREIRLLIAENYSRKTPVFPIFDTDPHHRCAMCA
jgi:hypothetical protein